jgi:molybdopterin converting factor subunit 1
MKVHVRLFARAKDLVGADAVFVELPDGACVNELRRRLTIDYPTLAALLERSAIAVNNEFADNDVVLSARTEIALLPPVSGG